MTRLAIRKDSVSVRINVIREGVEAPQYGTALSAGFDLAPAHDVHLLPGESDVYPTGLIIQAPPSHMLMVAPRSSTWRKWGVSLGNTIGIVDEDFCGPEDELCLYLHNPGREPVEIPRGVRLAQGIFVPVTHATFNVVDGAIAETRGGWGSTGD